MFKSTWWEMAGELWLHLWRVEVVVQLSVFSAPFIAPQLTLVCNFHFLDTHHLKERPSELIKELECYLD